MKRHKGKQRYTHPRILILCEGETEKNYFKAILQDSDYKSRLSAVRVSIYSGKDSSPEKIVNEALKRSEEANNEGNPFKSIWVVFDHDNHPNRHLAYQNALSLGFNIAFSAIAFEQWYLLHFLKSSRAFTNYANLEKEILRHYPNYQKAKQNDFKNLKQKLPAAFMNAEWLRKQIDKPVITNSNPWTDVDILVKMMIKGTF